jgi:hypothetical protein
MWRRSIEVIGNLLDTEAKQSDPDCGVKGKIQ